ncbi:MAG: hypothetical protein AB7U73_20555, partial [Pirellulales bacterium]
GNRPVRTYRLGLISAAVFANTREAQGEQEGRVVHTVQLQRRYRDGEGNWKTSASFDLSTLPAAIEALRLALAYLVERELATVPPSEAGMTDDIPY